MRSVLGGVVSIPLPLKHQVSSTDHLVRWGELWGLLSPLGASPSGTPGRPLILLRLSFPIYKC